MSSFDCSPVIDANSANSLLIFTYLLIFIVECLLKFFMKSGAITRNIELYLLEGVYTAVYYD